MRNTSLAGERPAMRMIVAHVWLMVMVMALSGCGTTTITGGGVTDRAQTTATASVADTRVYTNQEHAFSFRYPAAWELREDLEIGATSGGGAAFSVGVFDPDGTQASGILVDGLVCSVYQLGVTVEPSMMNELRAEVEDVLAGLAQQQAGLKTLEELTQAQIGGLTGFKTTLSFPRNGLTLVTGLYFLFAGDREYQLIVQAGEARWEGLGPEFDVVLSSFAGGS